MPIEIGDRVFTNPVVDKVFFQIRFPTLFYIEGRIGDLQSKLMTQFPEASLQISRTFALVSRESKSSVASDDNADMVEKIWTFESKDGVQVEVKRSSLTLVSQRHKSYRSGPVKFRESIEFVLAAFKSVIDIPIVQRLGLRYVDICPIPDSTRETLKSWFNTTLPIERFDPENSQKLLTHVESTTPECSLRFIELFKSDGATGPTVTLDFDASINDIAFTEVLEKTDTLHGCIRRAFETAANPPLKEYMERQEAQVDDNN